MEMDVTPIHLSIFAFWVLMPEKWLHLGYFGIKILKMDLKLGCLKAAVNLPELCTMKLCLLLEISDGVRKKRQNNVFFPV